LISTSRPPKRSSVTAATARMLSSERTSSAAACTLASIRQGPASPLHPLGLCPPRSRGRPLPRGATRWHVDARRRAGDQARFLSQQLETEKSLISKDLSRKVTAGETVIAVDSWRREALWRQTLFWLGFAPADTTLSSPPWRSSIRTSSRAATSMSWCAATPPPGTRGLVHRWCRPGRSPRSTSYALADA
jgi:hypothetical protein